MQDFRKFALIRIGDHPLPSRREGKGGGGDFGDRRWDWTPGGKESLTQREGKSDAFSE